MNLYLTFPDQSTADKVLGKNEDGGYSFDGQVDEIGLIYKETGNMLDGETGPYPEMKAVKGWHVNVIGNASKEVQAYAVEVSTPYRVWA